MSRKVRVAVFRPDDGRLEEAVELLDSLGATPIGDSMLAIEPTGATPDDGAFVIFTSSTGIEVADEAGWTPGDETLVTIGPRTATAAENVGWEVDLIPKEYSSSGLVQLLEDRVAGQRVEIARSDNGSRVLPAGLRAAGGDVHETVLYELVRPAGSGESAEMAARGDLEAVAFTSPLTVEHFLEAADAAHVREEAIEGLSDTIVGVIGDPTKDTAENHGIDVDVVPENADFEELTCALVEAAAPSYTE